MNNFARLLLALALVSALLSATDAAQAIAGVALFPLALALVAGGLLAERINFSVSAG